MQRFIPINREDDLSKPISIQDCLPEGHLARYIVEVVESIDLSNFEQHYAGRGSEAYPPSLLLQLFIYAYATGIFSTRKIERATYDIIPFRYIACNLHPDHDTLAKFRKRFKKEFEEVFVQVLRVAKETGIAQFGKIKVAVDGTKIHANASRHSAMSYAHAEKIEAQIKDEVLKLMELAKKAENIPEGMVVPDEIKRREDRLASIAEAKVKIEARAKERFEQEQAEYAAKVQARRDKEEATGKKARGKEPTPPVAGPDPKDQVNLTDEESRIMLQSGGSGFEQCYNAQAAVDVDSLLIVTLSVTQDANDKKQIEPTLEQLKELPKDIAQPEQLLADTGYCSEHNVKSCETAQIEPMIASKREQHHTPVLERFADDPPALQADATPMERMKHRLKTREGRKTYAKRKQTVEPVFGIIKGVMGFRQFLTRGLENVRNEWNLVCLAWNLKRMAALRP
jgi:transposase